MPHYAKRQDCPELEQVVTLAEACRLTKKTYNTLRYAIDAGNIAARPCGRNWLVSKKSLFDWFKPLKNTSR